MVERIEVIIKEGDKCFEQGNLAGAIELYDCAIRIDPKAWQAWNNKGYALNELQRFAEAVVAYQKAIGLVARIKTGCKL